MKDRLIFNMGIPILERRHPYIETTPWRFCTLRYHSKIADTEITEFMTRIWKTKPQCTDLCPKPISGIPFHEYNELSVECGYINCKKFNAKWAGTSDYIYVNT